MPTAVITGANKGLGLELTRQYTAEGWTVYALNRRSSSALDELADAGSVRVIQTDLTDDESIAAAVKQIDVPAVDLLVNNAGTMGRGSFAESGMDYQKFGSFDRGEWQDVFDINVFTPMALVERLHVKLKHADKPVVITISSMLGSNAMNSNGNLYAYRASKAAVNSIMRSLGMNLKADGIISIAMHPGWVQTDMGGDNAELTATDSVRGMRRVIGRLALHDAGKFLAHDGKEMPY